MSIRCEHCAGSGLADKPGPNDDDLLDRVVLYAIEIGRLTAALESIVRESNGVNKGAVAQKIAIDALAGVNEQSMEGK